MREQMYELTLKVFFAGIDRFDAEGMLLCGRCVLLFKQRIIKGYLPIVKYRE